MPPGRSITTVYKANERLDQSVPEPMMDDLSDKTILVTGASKGIGASIARILGAAGAAVIVHYATDRPGAEETARAIPADRKLLVQADLHDNAAAVALWQKARAWRNRVDVVVNNAGIMLDTGDIDADDDTWDAIWEETLQVNVVASARLLRDAVRHFRETGGGTIITVSSLAAHRGAGKPGNLAYAASKAAIKCLTQSVARTYAHDRVLAFVIAPGLVHTQMAETFVRSQGGEEKVFSSLPMREWADPDQLGHLVAFLASGKARHLSGATLDINGASYIR
jgi:NAD(P)-dependent dehydrogenase (short-subunit alcohol dehydrogenase family)